MKAIYEPKGAALEYAPLACNLFTGCTHGCRYCYAAGMAVRWGQAADRAGFHAEVRSRPGLYRALWQEAARLASEGDTRRILLCFTTDAFQADAGQSGLSLSLAAMGVLAEHGRPYDVLTKGCPTGATLAVMAKHPDARLGMSLVWYRDERRAEWEPGAASVESRLLTLRAARALGVQTFASVEPVIDPDEALAAIYTLIAAGVSDIRVGRLNHMPTPHPVDWTDFVRRALAILRPWQAADPGRRRYLLKRGLAELVP